MPTGAGCPDLWKCGFAAAETFVAAQRGYLGIEVRDRRTGAVWTSGAAKTRIWAASTPKLALAVALRELDRAKKITLSGADEKDIAAMLAVSDNAAADRLWDKYAVDNTLISRFRYTYGMRSAGYVSGFPRRWGFIKCSAHDLSNLMSYVLDTLDRRDRAEIVEAMRGVGSVQRWGVWAVGPQEHPGVKNGWSIERDDDVDHWVTATVGFAGPDERYVVAVMYHQLPGGDTIDHGVHVVTDLVATVFNAPTPAPAVIPPPDS